MLLKESMTNKFRHGVGAALKALDTGIGLPPIRGRWIAVDPYATYRDYLNMDVVPTLRTAYDECVSGRGDGILVLSGGTTAANTTSYLSYPLVWSKHGVTVYGVHSGTRLYGRARVANVEHTTGSISTIAFPTATTITDSAAGFLTAGFVVGDVIRINTTENTNDSTGNIITAVTAGTITCAASTFTIQTAVTAGATTINSYNAQMIIVSGSNNVFHNIHVGNFSSDAAALGCLQVTGNRNEFNNCHFIGAGHATPAAQAAAYDLEINGGQENTFVGCTFGTDTIIRAAANGNIRFDTNAWRSRFYGCEILSYSATVGKGAIMCVDATGMEGIHSFVDCQFHNWNENGIDKLDSLFIGTKPTSGAIHLHNPGIVGYTATDSVSGNDMVYVTGYATAAGAGGLSTTV